jgi:hypothetical protein
VGGRDAQNGFAGVKRSVRKRAHLWCEIDPDSTIDISATIAVAQLDVLDTAL